MKFKNLIHSLKDIDLISSEIKFNYKGHNKFTSYFGSALTICLIIVILVIGLSLTISVFQYSDPKTSTSNIFENFTSLNLSSNYPMMLVIVDSLGQPLKNQDQYFTISAFSFYTKFNSNGASNITIKNVNLVKCSQDIFNNQFGSYGKLFQSNVPSNLINYTYCIPINNNSNYFIQNAYGSDNSQFISILLNYCVNTTQNSNFCKSRETINSVISSYYVFPTVVNFYFDHNKRDPALTQVTSKPFTISSSIYKRIFVNYKAVQYKSDFDLLTSSNNHTGYHQISSFSLEVGTIGNGALSPNAFFQVILSFETQIVDVYLRSYQKIPQLLAEISGIFNFLFLICYILNFYFEIKLREQEIFDACSSRFQTNKNLDTVKAEVENKSKFSRYKSSLSEEVIVKPNEKFKNNKITLANNFTNEFQDKPKLIQTGIKEIVKVDPHSSILYEFEKLIQDILTEETHHHHYRNIFPCGRKKIVEAKLSIAKLFYSQVFDVIFIFNNILDFQELKKNSNKN